MREQIKQDIDLIEILFYLKKKIRVILFDLFTHNISRE